MQTSPIYIKNVSILTEETIMEDSALLLESGKISKIGKQSALPDEIQEIDGKGKIVIPGFIDGHIHGANGADVMDASNTALDSIASVLPREGTTSFLATTITQSPENIEKALKTVAAYKNKPGQAEVIGVHLEGPFIEKSKAGAQPHAYIMEPSIEQFEEWQKLSGDKIKTITMAPEHDPDGTFIRHVSDQGVIVSAGHTNSSFSDMKQAVEHGVKQVTHLCNAMTGLHHRDVGTVGAAFMLHELRAELIADGIHISKEMLQLVYKTMGSERLLLITDSMRAKCLQQGRYELGGQPVVVTEDRAVLEDGTLAGSILKMRDGAKQMLDLDGVTLQEVIEMASVNPAKQLGLYDRKGSITVGKDADLLLVDRQLHIASAICRGEVAFREE
ncbi:N-acetylglucosamine-6-phosphate deacetylase [Oceanobacillus jordanicus]|uniref:N-acetylglucosamine-6-phosphate deacetylase n=1 Tax=Oceanobacillus jordanicus TaxID=2867266 RepID=A0AAW5B862_9BACI|nr:N-acetylglucosamine-6-phosphate deacetylase [Oceanobacillus jordanicus]MCG3420586.1 N-acetylglucosamine-6-phosphate deacetylase [Oceanobacillus jordanicus]